MTKKNRHKIIVDLVSTENINNQDMLLELLLSKGYNITQATLSRDMKELRIIKSMNDKGEYVYRLTDDNKKRERLFSDNLSAYGFIQIEFSGQLAVIKTRPGYAMAIAGEIDAKATNTILGTVAGDDTILLIPRENISKEKVINSLSEFIPNI